MASDERKSLKELGWLDATEGVPPFEDYLTDRERDPVERAGEYLTMPWNDTRHCRLCEQAGGHAAGCKAPKILSIVRDLVRERDDANAWIQSIRRIFGTELALKKERDTALALLVRVYGAWSTEQWDEDSETVEGVIEDIQAYLDRDPPPDAALLGERSEG